MLAPKDPVVDKPDTVHDPRFPVHVTTGLVEDGQSTRAYTSYCLGFKHRSKAARYRVSKLADLS